MKNLNKQTDSALVLAYKAGDKKALSLLVKRWHLQFCKLAFWVVKDADVAKDIAQESWKVVFNKLTDLKDETKFKSWAISIVNRKAIDYLRANQRRDVYLRSYKKELEHNITIDSEDDITFYKEKIRKVVEDLPKNQKIVVQLFYVQNYSLKEIATLLNLSVGTTKSRLFHAREKIKLNLKNRNYE
ncbi:RNA polymerase sigma factor [Tenacibaculum crassostreae]|uniref:RNA polymerase sigma factor n=1 Tax=Tenacibaculum crassostreae TaxID=502683 RepID=UPI0038959995